MCKAEIAVSLKKKTKNLPSPSPPPSSPQQMRAPPTQLPKLKASFPSPFTFSLSSTSPGAPLPLAHKATDGAVFRATGGPMLLPTASPSAVPLAFFSYSTWLTFLGLRSWSKCRLRGALPDHSNSSTCSHSQIIFFLLPYFLFPL